MTALAFAVAAHVRATRGAVGAAAADLATAVRLLDELDEFAPWYEIETRVCSRGPPRGSAIRRRRGRCSTGLVVKSS